MLLIASTLVFARHRNGELATYESTARDGTFMLRLPPDTGQGQRALSR